jgi:hypothetical protein
METKTETKSDTKARRYKGGCVCGAVRYEVELDLGAGTSRCNCSICTKASLWSAMVRPEAFTLLAGEDDLADYQRGGKFSHFLFCKRCGVRSFSRGDAPWMGGPYVSIQVACLDDADLGGVTVLHFDGRHDNWAQPRVERLP